MSAAEDFRALQSSVDAMMRELDVSAVRPIQKASYLCCHDCIDPVSTPEMLQRCVERCTQGPAAMQRSTQQIMGQFQDRLQRCVKDCEDRARDSFPMGAQPTPEQQVAAQRKMEACASVCSHTHAKMLPKIQQDLQRVSDQIRNS